MILNKKGLSDVVTTVLIILLVLAAVALIWGFLYPFFKGTGSQITGATSCMNLQMETVSCLSDGAATDPKPVVTYRWTGGSDLTLSGVKVSVYKTDGSNEVIDGLKVNYLASGTATSTRASQILWAAADKASVAGVITLPDGTTATCTETQKITCNSAAV